MQWLVNRDFTSGVLNTPSVKNTGINTPIERKVAMLTDEMIPNQGDMKTMDASGCGTSSLTSDPNLRHQGRQYCNSARIALDCDKTSMLARFDWSGIWLGLVMRIVA